MILLLKLFYNLPKLSFGSILIEKIELNNPIIKIIKLDGIWNFQKILPNSKENKEYGV